MKINKIDNNNQLPTYSKKFRLVEIFSIIAFVILWSLHFYKSFFQQPWNMTLVVVTFVSSWLAADFISGVVHWFADTWGTVNWPVIGPTLIRSFREHHVDKLAITRHDFIETNGASALICLPLLLYLFFTKSIFVILFIVFFTFWIFFTNQFHKWGHTENPPTIVLFFQRIGIILNYKNHERHHRHLHDECYFITSGFLNYFIRAPFFRNLELLVSKLTGMKPREEDSVLY